MNEQPVRISLSVSHRFVWHRVAKTGTRSLNSLLMRNIEDYQYLQGAVEFDAEQRRLLSSPHFAFTMVRNPWSRVWSAWNNKIVGSGDESAMRKNAFAPGDRRRQDELAEDFALFIRLLGDSRPYRNDPHFMTQAAILGNDRLDHVGRFERYVDEVEFILDRVGLGGLGLEIPHGNRSRLSGAYAENFGGDSIRIVGELYRADIERWGYSFGDPG